MQSTNAEHLRWLRARMIEKYQENPKADFIRRLDDIIIEVEASSNSPEPGRRKYPDFTQLENQSIILRDDNNTMNYQAITLDEIYEALKSRLIEDRFMVEQPNGYN